ncbi:MAG: DrmE family protein [Methanosarcina mazei]
MWCSEESNNFQFNYIDRLSILFLRLLLDKQKDGFIVYPFNKMNLLPVLAAEALYHRVPKKERKKILLIGDRNICIRDSFQKLKNASNEPLEKYFSIGIVKPDGTVNNISKMKYNMGGKKRILEPLLLFSPNVNTLPNEKIGSQIFSIIIEIDSNTENNFFKILKAFKNNTGLKCIFYVTSDPYCEQVKTLLSSDIPFWSWEQNEVNERLKSENTFSFSSERYINNPFSTPLYQIKKYSDGIEKFILPVKEDELNKMLLHARENFRILLKHSHEINSSILNKASINYLKVIHSFEQLTSPLVFSEREYSGTWGTTTIENKIEYLLSIAENLRTEDSTASSFYYRSVEDLKHIYSYLKDRESGKPVIVIQIIEESIRNNKKLSIVVKNRASKRALLNFLESSYNMDEKYLTANRITVEYSKYEDDLEDSDLGLFYNPSFKFKKLLRNTCCSKIVFLAYPSEIRSLKYLIEDEFNESNSISSYDRKVNSIQKILKISKNDVESSVKRPSKSISVSKKPIIIDPQDSSIVDFKCLQISSELSQIDLSVDSEFSELDYCSELFYENLPGSYEMKRHSYSRKVNANLLKLEGNKGLFVAVDKNISVYQNWNKKVIYKKASEAKVCDLLVLVNNGLKKTLAEQVVDIVEKHPKMIEVVIYQKYWVESLRKNMLSKKDTPTSLFKKLNDKGSQVKTSAAVYFWAEGVTIGPSKRNRDNIKFIGEIYEDKFLIDNYEKIYNSIDRLRRIHIRLKRNLHMLMIDAGLMLENGGEDKVIDEDLGLYLEDFANSIAIKRIVSIEGPYDIETYRMEQIFDV